MSTKIKIIFFCLFLTNSAYSQGMEVISTQKTLLNLTRDSRLASVIDLSEVQGSPYLIDSFSIGTIYTNRGEFNNMEIRYNIYNDLIEFKQKQGILSLYPSPPIEIIKFENYSLEVCKLELKGEIKYTYLFQLDTGRISLLAKKNVLYKEKEEAKPMSYSGTKARFTNLSDSYYLKIKDEFIKVGSTKKIIDYYPMHNEELRGYVKKNDISLKNAEDLKKLNKFYNTL